MTTAIAASAARGISIWAGDQDGERCGVDPRSYEQMFARASATSQIWLGCGDTRVARFISLFAAVLVGAALAGPGACE